MFITVRGSQVISREREGPGDENSLIVVTPKSERILLVFFAKLRREDYALADTASEVLIFTS